MALRILSNFRLNAHEGQPSTVTGFFRWGVRFTPAARRQTNKTNKDMVRKAKTFQVCRYFDTLKEMRAYIDNTPPLLENVIKNHRHSEEGSHEFTGTADMSEANVMLTAGYPEGVKELTTVKAKPSRNGQMEIFRSFQGFTPSVGDVVAGNPSNMLNARQSVKTSCKVVDVVLGAAFSCEWSTEDIMKEAKKAVQAVMTAENNGYRVNLYVCFSSAYLGDKRDKNNTCDILIKIKGANQKMDLLRVSYPVIHPSFLRRHVFAVMERSVELNKGYGCADKPTEKAVKACNKAIKQPRIINLPERLACTDMVSIITN